MSQAFVKETDPQWLHEIAPTMRALVLFLTLEYNGKTITENRSYFDPERTIEFHEMSDGLTYFINQAGHWDTLSE